MSDIEHPCPECGTLISGEGGDWGDGYQCSDCNIVWWPDLPELGVVHLQTLF